MAEMPSVTLAALLSAGARGTAACSGDDTPLLGTAVPVLLPQAQLNAKVDKLQVGGWFMFKGLAPRVAQVSLACSGNLGAVGDLSLNPL